jgi:hypothetical protein
MSAGWAFAQAPTNELFQSLDLNGDGYVSLSEAAGEAVVVQRFDRADKDRDGKLSRAEYDNVGAPRPAKAKAKNAKAKTQAKAKTAAEPR